MGQTAIRLAEAEGERHAERARVLQRLVVCIKLNRGLTPESFQVSGKHLVNSCVTCLGESESRSHRSLRGCVASEESG